MSPSSANSPGSIIATLLAGAWRCPPPPLHLSHANVEAVTPLLLQSLAAPLSWARIRNSELRPPLEHGELHRAYLYLALQTRLRQSTLKDVFALLRAAGVEPILIKGWALMHLYPEPGLRPCNDVDLWVAPELLSTAEAALKSVEERQYHVDLKHDVVTKFDRRSWEEMYSRSRLVRFDDMNVRVLGPEDHLRFICIHALKHGVSRPVWLCDVAVAIESRPNDFDWDLCLGRVQPQADWVACAIGLAHQLLGVRVADTSVAHRATHLPEWLLPSVLKRWALPEQIDTQRMGTRLRRGGEVFKGLRRRWPDPIGSAVGTMRPLDDKPSLLVRSALYSSPQRIRKFIKELPGLWQEQS